jgi:hypothetical protein
VRGVFFLKMETVPEIGVLISSRSSSKGIFSQYSKVDSLMFSRRRYCFVVVACITLKKLAVS